MFPFQSMISNQMHVYTAIFIAGLLLYRYIKVRLAYDHRAAGRDHKAPKAERLEFETYGDKNTELYKELYYKIQNLENYPDVLPTARQSLLFLLQQGLSIANYKSRTRSILDIEQYDTEKLQNFLVAEQQDVGDEWECYIQRRRAGAGMELFVDRDGAIAWLKRYAPLNYIDGAWLSRIHRITTPFALREITRGAWQTVSEEFGDGDLMKNHVFLYQKILQSAGVILPDAHTKQFVHSQLGMDDGTIWRAATAQLLISLFPNDFLPEILGFNLHFEQLSVQTLKASKELPEVGISGYYFNLHISIDNADSGHSAIALALVKNFMNHVHETGSMESTSAWKRIQAGYILSESLDGRQSTEIYEKRLATMLHRKLKLANKIHCSSSVKIGKKALSDWFSLSDKEGNRDFTNDVEQKFLLALANTKPWVYRGDSARSLLVRELSWQGRMFGAFTPSEVNLLRTWIESLPKHGMEHKETYWTIVGGNSSVGSPRDVASTHPVFPPCQHMYRHDIQANRHKLVLRPPLVLPRVCPQTLLPLWFVHPCLLENMMSSPYMAAARLPSFVLQFLRAERNLDSENSGSSGMDQQLHPEYLPDLIDIGLELVHAFQLPEPLSLADLLVGEPPFTKSPAASFAYDLLNIAMRPQKEGMFLLGMARAFVDLEIWVASSDSLLPTKKRHTLTQIIDRKLATFDACLFEIGSDHAKCREVVVGYESGRTQIESILR